MTLKQKLDYHYKAFDKSQISPDPLQFLHLYKNENDVEIIGLISSIFSYGNVKQIVSTINKIVNILGEHPFDTILNFNKKEIDKVFSGLIHRFYTTSDIQRLFYMLHSILIEEASLKKIFFKYYNEFQNETNLKYPLSEFSNFLLRSFLKSQKGISPGIRFMFADPLSGSACKRMNLYLRWMIRKDDLDFGLWNGIPTSKLIIPVDTHVAHICRKLNLTTRKNINWKMAEEITDNLKKFDPDDPVKYDFAICHIGMRKIIF